MTPADKAKVVFDRINEVTMNRYLAIQCSILFCDEMIKTFKAVVAKYSRDFQQSVNYWVDVKKELLSLE